MNNANSRVLLDHPETTNLLGLLMQGLLSRNLESPVRQRILARLRGDLRVQAGKMTATLAFADGRITIFVGPRPRPRAWIKGSMDGLLGLITATDPVRPLVTRAVTFGGNPLWLAAVVPLVLPGDAVKDALLGAVPAPFRPS